MSAIHTPVAPDYLQEEGGWSAKRVYIAGLSGLGKTISVEAFLSAKSGRKQRDLLNHEKGQL